jgi:hypothetical protein
MAMVKQSVVAAAWNITAADEIRVFDLRTV